MIIIEQSSVPPGRRMAVELITVPPAIYIYRQPHGFRVTRTPIGMTLEMPFLDSLEAPDGTCGWSASASMTLGRQCVGALQDFVTSHR